MLYKEYEPEILQKLQAIELKILADFANFCEEHEIDYFGCGGTMLGAVRHKGFIPWDDDIDIGMTREHYDKFLALADNAYDGRYRILNAEIDPKFSGMLSKWYRVGTLFRDKDSMVTGYKAGIAIDIFCFDNVADDDKALRRQAMSAWGFGKLFILRNISKPTVYVKGFRGKVTAGISMVVNGVLRLLHVSPSFLYRKADKAAQKYKDVETDRVAFLFDPTPYTSMLKRSDIYPTQFLAFENIKLRFTNKPEAYLEGRYGKDYMTPPAEDNRHNHPPMELDFGGEE